MPAIYLILPLFGSLFFFLAFLVCFLCSVGEEGKKNSKKEQKVCISLYCVFFAWFAVSLFVTIMNWRKDSEIYEKQKQYAYEHRFDNDVYVITGYNISNEVQDYLNHGYVLQGGASCGHTQVAQTVVRIKKD